ncbi:hypothetical protein RKD42_000575 [Streptomyces ambofaciens]
MTRATRVLQHDQETHPCDPLAQPPLCGLSRQHLSELTTRYIDAAVAQLKAENHELREEDIARVSPLKHRNLNLLGRYSFTASALAAPELDEDRSPAD